MQGLNDNYLPPNSREVGECIYCGERDAPLTTEHAVPYGLNGPWTLLRASGAVCSLELLWKRTCANRSMLPVRLSWPIARSAFEL